MTSYSSSEGPDPILEASWREYRQWRAAQRRRRWIAASACIAGVTAGAALLWPREAKYDTGPRTAALARFDAPVHDGPGSVVVAPLKAPESMPAIIEGIEPQLAVVAPSLAPPPPQPPPVETSLAVPPVTPPLPTTPPEPALAGSTTPPSDPAPAEPAASPHPSPKPTGSAAGAADPPHKRASHLQLASFQTETKARTALEQLRKQQGDLLGSLDARVERAELSDGRVVYRVRTGPLAIAEAKRICAELQRRRLDCSFVR
jgi:hypothetical protein